MQAPPTMSFNVTMTTQELMVWLKAEGLGSEDCERLRAEEFVGESFCLLKKEDIKELGIEMVDHLEHLLDKVTLGGGAGSDEYIFSISDVPLLCRSAPYEVAACCEANPGRSAAVYPKQLWDIKCLKVAFLNPEGLAKWTFQGLPITKATILEWANVWNPEKKDSIPWFEETASVSRAQIRVRFSDTGTCWSMVGKCAERVTKNSDPTMALDLSKINRQKDAEKRSLVIHEFGHALGLGHEHLRWDFWGKVGEHFDKDSVEAALESKNCNSEDKASSSRGKRATFERDYYDTTDGLKSSSVAYDPDSIMHYVFAFDWLKKDFRAKFNNKPKLLFKYDGISKEARNIFKSLFSKHYISENPSETDIRCLEEVYTRNVNPQ